MGKTTKKETEATAPAETTPTTPATEQQPETDKAPAAPAAEEKAKPKAKNSAQAPSCCRLVCYGTKPYAAIVTSVNEDGTVNLAVMNDDNNVVMFIHDVPETPSPCAKAWHWPARV